MINWTKYEHLRKFIPVLLLGLIAISCQDVPPNEPPVIVEIITYPSAPKAGQEVLITAIIQDEEGDNIRFRWMASGGTFLDSLGSNPITWKAPADTGVISVFLEASDQEATVSETYAFTLEVGVGSVAGHVTDQANGYLLEGVVVNINGEEFTTGADGYFVFDEILAGSNIPLSAAGENYVTYANLIDVEVQENIVDISLSLLTEVGRIAGYASDAVTGSKLAGVLVQTGAIQSITGEDGYYELYNVAISENVPVRASLSGYTIYSGLLNVVAGYNSKDIVLEPNIAIFSGRITSASDGSLLEGAIVSLNNQVDTTNAAGYYELTNVSVSNNSTLTVVMAGYVTAYELVNVEGGINVLNLQLDDNTSTLNGWVVSSLDGVNLSNATIYVGSSVTTTALDGSYNLTGLATGSHLFRCELDNFNTYTTVIELESGANRLDVSLNSAIGSVSGFITDAISGLAMDSVTIMLGSVATMSDETGAYLFSMVSLGQHQLFVEMENYQSYSALVEVVAGTVTKNITLQPSTGSVVGVVRDALTNLAIPGAIVVGGSASDMTDSDGYYALGNVSIGSVLISVGKEFYYTNQSVITVATGENIVDLTLEQATGDVMGTVLDLSDGNPLDSVMITLGDSVAYTDTSGHFSFMNYPRGTTQLSAELDNYQMYTLPTLIDAGPNQYLIEMGSTLGSLSGFVADAGSSAPLDSVQVILASDTTLTALDGTYQFDGIQVGTNILIQASRAGYVTLIDRVDIVSGDNIEDLVLTSSE